MKNYRILAGVATVATFVVIFVGGLVRVSGAGLGCPHWPQCFPGRWIPPTTLEQLPPDVDPATFNVTLAWIEYTNRVVGMSLGLVILATALLAFKFHRQRPRILWPSVGAALLVAIEGWQGSVVVGSLLNPMVVSVHLALALIIAGLLISATLEAWYLENPQALRGTNENRPLKVSFGILGGLSLVQIALGAAVRGHVEGILRQYPLFSSSEALSHVGGLEHAHLAVGIIVVLGAAHCFVSTILRGKAAPLIVRQAAWASMGLVTVQLILGISMLAIGLPSILQVFHLWVACLFLGCAFIAFTALRKTESSPTGIAPQAKTSPSEPRLSGAFLAGVIIIPLALITGLFTITSAEKSQRDISAIGTVPGFRFQKSDGQPFGSEEMAGKITIVDFIFTRCPNICPIMSQSMMELYQRYALTPEVGFLSISVDPDFDSLAVLREYATRYGVNDDRWVFLRGELDSVRTLYEKGFLLPGADNLPGGHSPRFVLVDRTLRIRGYYESGNPMSMEALVNDVRAVAAEK